jgi:dephospho-CoA kinase
MKKKIAITGGIGSGKSTAIDFFRKKGYPVFSCDEIYKEIIIRKPFIEKIREIFPSAVQNDKIDKIELGKIVFFDERARNQLNALSHALIMSELNDKMSEVNAQYVFAEVPLLFEGEYQKEFDMVIVVMREEEERIAAIQQRDHIQIEQIKSRMAVQFDYDKLKDNPSLFGDNVYLVLNKGEIEVFENKLEEMFQKILST